MKRILSAAIMIALSGCTSTALIGENYGNIGNSDGGDDGPSSCREVFPPASCQAPDGPVRPVNAGDIAALLPGRWIFCGTDPTEPLKFGPADHVGIEFRSDSSWHFLYSDMNGVAVIRGGFNSGGTYRIYTQDCGGSCGPHAELDLALTEGGTFTTLPAISDNPRKLRIVNGLGGINLYIRSPAPVGCGDAQDQPDMTRLPPVDMGPPADLPQTNVDL